MIAEVRGEGLLIGLKCEVPNGEVIDAFRAEKLLAVGAGDNVARLVPPLIVTEAEVAEAIARVDRACTAIERAQRRSVKAGSGRMSTGGIRHFLDLIDIPRKQLREMIETSRAMKKGRAQRPARARWPARPLP